MKGRIMQKTTMLKKEQAMANKKWYIIDATDLVLGRLSTNVAIYYVEKIRLLLHLMLIVEIM